MPLCVHPQVRSDLFKLTYTVRRPRAERADSIGIWMELLTMLVWLSVITNTFLFGFTTEQMATVFPEWFDHVESLELGGMTGR
jgi:hypothetical protein